MLMIMRRIGIVRFSRMTMPEREHCTTITTMITAIACPPIP
jgi:hypothetical protein